MLSTSEEAHSGEPPSYNPPAVAEEPGTVDRGRTTDLSPNRHRCGLALGVARWEQAQVVVCFEVLGPLNDHLAGRLGGGKSGLRTMTYIRRCGFSVRLPRSRVQQIPPRQQPRPKAQESARRGDVSNAPLFASSLAVPSLFTRQRHLVPTRQPSRPVDQHQKHGEPQTYLS